MKQPASRTVILQILIVGAVLIAGLSFLSLPSPAQTKKSGGIVLSFSEPFRNYQFAYANGFQDGVRHVYEQIRQRKLTYDGLAELAENKDDLLKELAQKGAVAYQQKLIKLNPSVGRKKQ